MTGCFSFLFPAHRRVAKDAQAKFDSAFTKLFNMFTQISHGPMRITNDLLPEPAKLTPQEQRVGVFHVQSFMRMAHFCLPHVRAVANTDRAYCMIHSILLKAIDLTDQNSSFRSGAEARLLLVRAFLVDRRVANLTYSQRQAYWWQQEVESVTMCDWVINSTSPAVSSAMKNDAKNWKKAIRNKEIVMVKQAATHSPQSRGGTWLSCRRGHQYLVGGCGTPQEAGRCVECGLQIGSYRGLGDT